MGGFNAEEYQEKPEFDNSPLPEGDYYVEIENAEIKETANKKGTGCNMKLAVLGDVHDNGHKGRKMFNWFTLQHENDMAQSIGQREFHALRLAIGKPTATDTDELIGQNLVIRVGFEKKDPTRNYIKRFMALEGYEKPDKTEAKAPAPAASAPSSAVKKNPWD
tara:strand:- start:2966 stop:3454 length:489 start_codon:yes stop_codon:yes gene_type:complete